LRDRPLSELAVWIIIFWNIYAVLASPLIIGVKLDKIHGWNIIAAGILAMLFALYALARMISADCKKWFYFGLLSVVLMWLFHFTGELHETYLQSLQITAYFCAFCLARSICRRSKACSFTIAYPVWKSVKIFFKIEIGFTVLLRVAGVFKNIDATKDSATYAGKILGPLGFIVPAVFAVFIIAFIYLKSRKDSNFFDKIKNPVKPAMQGTYLIFQKFGNFNFFIKFVFNFFTPGHVLIIQDGKKYSFWKVGFRSGELTESNFTNMRCRAVKIDRLDIEKYIGTVIKYPRKTCYSWINEILEKQTGKGILKTIEGENNNG